MHLLESGPNPPELTFPSMDAEAEQRAPMTIRLGGHDSPMSTSELT